MRTGITKMPEKGYELTLLANGEVQVALYREPQETTDNDGNTHVTADVLYLRRRNFAGLAQSIEANFNWYWQQAEQEAEKLAKEKSNDINTQLDKLRADIDYMAMMSDVDFGEDESEDINHEQEV